MLNLFERSVERVIWAYGLCTETWPLLRLHATNPAFLSAIDRLMTIGSIRQIQIRGTRHFLSLPSAINYLLFVSNGDSITVGEQLNISQSSIEKHLSNQSRNYKLDSNGRLDISAYKNIIFDLGGVIADESDLDASICNYFNEIIRKGNYQWSSYDEFIMTLEQTFDVGWYDYYAQAAQFGISASDVDDLHYRFIDKVRFYEGSQILIEKLTDRGHKLFLITGCNSRVLRLRLKLYGIKDYFDDRFISSDIGGELGNKEKYFESFFHRFLVSPSNLLFITDNYTKDVLPALMFPVATLYFAAGGRINTAYNSHGVQPSDPIALSLMCSMHKTAIEYPFSDFNQILSVIDVK